MWICPKCSAKVDPSFEVCWQCGTTPEGVEDPTFVTADQEGPGEPSPLFPGIAAAGEDGAELTDELPDLQSADLVECYWARDSMQADYIAAELNERGIPALADSQDLRLRGAGAATTNPLALGNPYFGPRVRVRREDLARAKEWLEAYEESQSEA